MIGRRARFDEGQGRAVVQGLPHGDSKAMQDAGGGRGHHVLHLHGLQHGDRLTGGDRIASGDLQADHGAAQGRGDGDRARRGRRHRIRRAILGLLGRRRGQGRRPRQEPRQIGFQERRVRAPLKERLVLQHRPQEGQCRWRPLDPELRRRAAGARRRGGERRRMDHQLCDQGIERRIGPIPPVAITIHADPGSAGRLVAVKHAARATGDLAIRGQSLEVHAKLDGDARDRRRTVRQAARCKTVARRQSQLQLNQIKASDRLGHGVLDLNSRIGLDEGRRSPIIAIHQVLEGGQAAQFRSHGHAHRRRLQGVAQGGGQADGRGHLDQFLSPALDRALAVMDRDRVDAVAGHLHLDVPRVRDQDFGIEPPVAERPLRFPRTRRIGLCRIHVRIDHPHPTPAAAGQRLDHDRPANRGLQRADIVQPGGSLDALCERHAVLSGEGPGADLVAEQVKDIRAAAHEGQAGVLAGSGERRALGQEAVARVDGVATGRQGGLHQRCDVEVGPRAYASQGRRLVRQANMQGGRIILRIDGDGRNPQIGGRAGDPDGDLAPVGDQQALQAVAPCARGSSCIRRS